MSGRDRYPDYDKRRKGRGKPGILLIILLVLIAGVVFALLKLPQKEEPEEAALPSIPEPEIVSSATIGSTGDILIHSPIYESAAVGGGQYDFSRDFKLVAPYYAKPDVMVANLEVTCAGEEEGYSSYPLFNCPDNIVTTLANAGVDVCLTANNHSNDSSKDGMLRTLEVVKENGLDHLGTRASTDEHYIWTKIVNGIKLGMVCYTYDSREEPDEPKSLNGNPLVDGSDELVNSFCYSDLESFYEDAQSAIDQMRMLGVEANIFYLHWGNEYNDDPNEYQTEMAQRLCEMGADVIIGGHPHVVQRYETLTSKTGHKTLCLYSMGNEISNQRANLMDEDDNRGYTEDGVVFNVTFSKFNNGRVKITGLDILPTWVDLTDDGEGRVYSIVALDHEKDPSSWGASSEGAAINSYNRTMGRISDGYNRFRESIRLKPDPESF